MRGRHAFGYPAHSNSSNEGTHGGILIIHDTVHGLTKLENILRLKGVDTRLSSGKQKPDPSWSLRSTSRPTRQSKDRQTHSFWPAYWHYSKQQHGNLSLWETGTTTQNTSRALYSAQSSTGRSLHRMQPCSTGTRLTMRQNIASCASMTTEWAVPWRPHCLVTYALELEEDFRNYNELRTFPPLPHAPDIGFTAWSAYVTQVEDLTLYESAPNQSARGLADWASIAEQYLLQQHPCAPRGRASNLTTQYQPLVPTTSGGMWKKGKAAYWEQIQARLNIIQNQPTKAPGAIKGLNQALQQVQRHWIGDQTWAQFLDTQQHWQQYRDTRTFELLQHTVQQQFDEAQQHDETSSARSSQTASSPTSATDIRTAWQDLEKVAR